MNSLLDALFLKFFKCPCTYTDRLIGEGNATRGIGASYVQPMFTFSLLRFGWQLTRYVTNEKHRSATIQSLKGAFDFDTCYT